MSAVVVELNSAALAWGRLPAHNPAAVAAGAAGIVVHCVRLLTHYQSAVYTKVYRTPIDIERVRAAEEDCVPGGGGRQRAKTAARNLYGITTCKDECEVAQRHVYAADFIERLRTVVPPGVRVVFHLAPPLLSCPDPATSWPRKLAFRPLGPPAGRVLACAQLRPRPLGPHGRSASRAVLCAQAHGATQIQIDCRAPYTCKSRDHSPISVPAQRRVQLRARKGSGSTQSRGRACVPSRQVPSGSRLQPRRPRDGLPPRSGFGKPRSVGSSIGSRGRGLWTPQEPRT
ncbi:DUF6537 domain-containing protein [Crenalkalicoccus roseus]|uniref:DUF6537 domain-containing protein n=1 Tax=Crenalkalicoccus roseus TaxID=1485588 RepID=UPI0038D12554